jgi:thioredoxin reductase (NADPH)
MKKLNLLSIVFLGTVLCGCFTVSSLKQESHSFDATVFAGDSDVIPVAVIGGGVGGLTASVYLSMANIPTELLQGTTPGGLLTQSLSVRNWPGVVDAPGMAIADSVRAQAEKSGVAIKDEVLTGIDTSQWPYRLTIADAFDAKKVRTVRAMTVIIGIGAQSNYLGIPGEQEYWSRGVTNCAVCEGSLYKGKTVCVVGGGNSAMEEAHYLSGIAKKVYVFVRRDQLRATDNRKDDVANTGNIEMVYETSLTQINGDGEKVVSVETINNRTKQKRTVAMDGVFLAIGFTPNTKLFAGKLSLTDGGYIKLFDDQETSVPGVYAVGDIVDPKYKQAVTAAGDGCRAALQAHAFLKDARYSAVPAAKEADVQEQKEERVAAVEQPKVQPLASWITPGQVNEVPSVAAFKELLQTAQVPVIADFSAVWCGPCRQMMPVYKRVAKTVGDDAILVKIDIDVLSALASEYRVHGVPSFMFFKDGKMYDSFVGGGRGEDAFYSRL